MRHRLAAALSFIAILAAATAAADGPGTAEIGGDRFRSGSGSGERLTAPRDVFVAGGSVGLRGEAAGTAHGMGFDVDMEIDADAVYAMGATVEIEGTIARDATAMGASVEIDDDARIGGNARIMGATVTMEGRVAGALLALGGEVGLDGPVEGDARLVGGSIRFGDDARVGGILTYSAPERIDVPASVAPPDRVVYEPLEAPGVWRDFEEFAGDERSGWIGAASIVFGFLVTLAFIALVAALALGFAPQTVEARRRQALARPGLTLLVGALGLSALFGLVPVAAMTVVGILFVPIVALAVAVVWAAGYTLGAYVVGLRLWIGLGGEAPALGGRVAIVAGATAVVALLNFIPVLGWLANFALTLFGIGALTAWALDLIFDADGAGDARPAVASDEP